MIINKIGNGPVIILVTCDKKNTPFLVNYLKDNCQFKNLKFVVTTNKLPLTLIKFLDTLSRPPALIIEISGNSKQILYSGPRALNILHKAGLNKIINITKYNSQLSNWLQTKHDLSSFKICNLQSKNLEYIQQLGQYFNGF